MSYLIAFQQFTGSNCIVLHQSVLFYSNHMHGNVYEHKPVCAHASNEYECVQFFNRHCVPTACEKISVILLDLDAVPRNLVLHPTEAIEKGLTHRCQLLGCVAVAKRDDCVKTIVCRRLHFCTTTNNMNSCMLAHACQHFMAITITKTGPVVVSGWVRECERRCREFIECGENGATSGVPLFMNG
jgi:hypothetical protein